MKLLAEKNPVHHHLPTTHGAILDWDTAIRLHLIDVNTRNGWNLADKEPPSWCDKWVPWIMAGLTLTVGAIVKLEIL